MLENQGFTVKGEVKDCDIAAARGDELWVIEMKLHLSINLLCQAVDRLSITPYVFIAVPRRTNIKRAIKLLKKLEIGLITVALDGPVKYAEVALFSGKFSHGVNKKVNKKSGAVRKEIEGRTDDTPGGSRGVKITTAYRERCIRIACILDQTSPLAPRALVREHGCEPDAGAILRKNFYGWFERISLGNYALSAKGRHFLEKNSDNIVIQEFKKLFSGPDRVIIPPRNGNGECEI